MSVLLVLLGFMTSSDRLAATECGTSVHTVELAQTRKVDGVRVVLRGSVAGTASRVTVAAGRFERAVTVLRGGRWGLKFGPALDVRSLTVTVEPAAPRGVCVEKVILLCGDEEVAVVTP